MAVNILGINHKTAPVALREKVAFTEDRLGAALLTLRQELGVAEALILSTCNRTEVYWSGTASGSQLSQWLERHHGNDLDLAASLYVHQESRAIEHTFSVASGLDSMVLGEVQILGQLKDAYRIAQESGSGIAIGIVAIAYAKAFLLSPASASPHGNTANRRSTGSLPDLGSTVSRAIDDSDPQNRRF